ncbi:MAG: c-type cytochrome [Neisseria sp.]|nr:c-type cytochrome [Neisseria sp.]
MKRFFPALLTALVAGGALAATPDLERGKEIAETVCSACHAADGNSAITIYPRLAGQHTEYMEAQAKAVRDGNRMWGLAVTMIPFVTGMSDDDIRNVSAYYSQQFPLAGEADPKMDLKVGAAIYRGGIPAQNVPACMSCHSPNGAGIPGGSTAKGGITAYPRIGGQHKDYVVEQMKAFRDGSRSHPNMDPIATRLTDEQIEEVSNYIQGLR